MSNQDNSGKWPEWWETLRLYLTQMQQQKFIECWNYLFDRENSRTILWAIANVLGLLSTILHKQILELNKISDRIDKLYPELHALESRVRTASEEMKESALKVYESSFELKRSTIPWDRALLVAFASCFMTAVTVYAMDSFHDHQKEAQPPTPPGANVSTSGQQ